MSKIANLFWRRPAARPAPGPWSPPRRRPRLRPRSAPVPGVSTPAAMLFRPRANYGVYPLVN